MNKIVFSRILFLIILFFVTSAQSTLQPKKPWTFLVYLAGASDLEVWVQQNLNQMMDVGSNDRINILVFLSTHYVGKPKETKKLYVNQGSLTQYGPTMARDSGSVETFKSALSWACNDFPSDHIAVVLWDHGTGPLNRASIPFIERGVCYDFDTGHYMTDRDILSAFSWARDTLRRGRKFDAIVFDACLMGSFEIACTLSSCANYMVASEDAVPGTGFDYYRILNVFARQTLDPLAFVKRMVTAYQDTYKYYSDYTLSAIDLAVLASFVSNFSQVSQFLTKQLDEKGARGLAAKTVIKKSAGDLFCLTFGGVYIDLLQFYKNLLGHVNDLKISIPDAEDFKMLLSNGIAQFPYFIRANATGSSYKQAGGLTIYFDLRGIHASYPFLYWSEKNGWWFDLLLSYFAV